MSSERQQRVCRCGFSAGHHMVSPEGHYTFWGAVCHAMGISAVPTKITFRCRVCGEVIDESTDPKVLKSSLGL